MKQYTSKEQTQHLIELGFPKPKSISDYDFDWDVFEEYNYYTNVEFEYNYSIGELIEFSNTTKFRVDIGLGLAKPCYVNTSAPTFEETMITCQWGHELIDLLYNLCVKAKEEGVI